MSTPIRASDRDLRALAAIVSQDRSDVPDGEGLPPSLLADLQDQIRCDRVSFSDWNLSPRAGHRFGQDTQPQDRNDWDDLDQVYWTHYPASQFCSYPVRTGDLGSITKNLDFYSARQWHSTGMYSEFYRPLGREHYLMLCLPDPAAGPGAGPERHLRLYFSRGPGPDFTERDRALLVLLRPHLRQAYRDAEQNRNPAPRLTRRQNELLHLLAAGHTNTQIARQLGISEGTVRTHTENIYEKLGVSSRTAAVTRALADRVT